MACAREVRGWGCGVVASRDGLVPGRGRGRETGAERELPRNARRRIRRPAGRGRRLTGGRGGEAGRATWRRRRRGVARAARAHLFRVGARARVVRGERRGVVVAFPSAFGGVDRTWRGRRPVVSFRRARLRGRATRLIAALETATLAGRDLDTSLKNFPLLNNRPASYGFSARSPHPLARFSADLADEPSCAPVSLSAAWRPT